MKKLIALITLVLGLALPTQAALFETVTKYEYHLFNGVTNAMPVVVTPTTTNTFTGQSNYVVRPKDFGLSVHVQLLATNAAVEWNPTNSYLDLAVSIDGTNWSTLPDLTVPIPTYGSSSVAAAAYKHFPVSSFNSASLVKVWRLRNYDTNCVRVTNITCRVIRTKGD
jgi:hypothetical protein